MHHVVSLKWSDSCLHVEIGRVAFSSEVGDKMGGLGNALNGLKHGVILNGGEIKSEACTVLGKSFSMLQGLSLSDYLHFKKQPGIAIGRLCEKCDGKCVICDSYVRPCTLVRVCDECNYGSFQGRCVICGGVGISDAYYCKECTQQEKDRDGCPKIVNLGSAKTDLFYERKKYGFKKR
ncbi:PHD finger-like domain-containing protein 5B [Tanacetum coccineum]